MAQLTIPEQIIELPSNMTAVEAVRLLSDHYGYDARSLNGETRAQFCLRWEKVLRRAAIKTQYDKEQLASVQSVEFPE